MKASMLIAGMLLLAGCATSSRTNRLFAGMERKDVIQAMGKPTSTNLLPEGEYLHYNLTERTDHGLYGLTHGEFVPYVVRLKDGKVEAFGRARDFNEAARVDVRVQK